MFFIHFKNFLFFKRIKCTFYTPCDNIIGVRDTLKTKDHETKLKKRDETMLNQILFAGSKLNYSDLHRSTSNKTRKNALIYTGRELELERGNYNSANRLGKLNLLA